MDEVELKIGNKVVFGVKSAYWGSWKVDLTHIERWEEVPYIKLYDIILL